MDERAAPRGRQVFFPAQNTDEIKPIFYSAVRGKVGEVMQYLAQGISLNVEYPGLGTLLDVARLHGHHELEQALLLRGADDHRQLSCARA